MASLLGYWCHNKTNMAFSTQLRAWSDKEIGAFFDHWERIAPTVSLFHETLEWAVEAKRRRPSCHVVYRRYIDEKRGISEGDIWSKWTVQQHLDEFMPWHRPGLILNMWNEPGPDPVQLPGFAQRAAAVMDAFGRDGVPLVMVNWGVGRHHESSETITALEPLWKAFDRWYDLHIAGYHEYGTHRGMLFEEPNGAYNVYPWRVGRAVDLIHPQVVARGHKGFRLMITEYGSDYAFDGQGGKRGYRDYWGGKQYGQQATAGVKRTKRPYVLGYCLYKIGNSSGWGDFDVLGDSDFRDEIEAGAKRGDLAPVTEVKPVPPPVQPPPPVVVVPPKPTYPQLPSADDPRWQKVIAAPKGGKVNVRNVPDKSGTVIGQIGTVEELFVITDESHSIWVPVKLQHGEPPIRGWVSTDVVHMVDVPPLINEPVLTMTKEHVRFLAAYYDDVAANHASIAESEASIAASNKEMAQFYRELLGETPAKENE